jgi:hypothetical protein
LPDIAVAVSLKAQADELGLLVNWQDS